MGNDEESPRVNWRAAMRFLFTNAELCTLGTVRSGPNRQQGPGPELEQSLMFFTFAAEDKLMLFTSAPDVKVSNLAINRKVAVMLNSFEGKAATNALLGSAKPVAMTVYGSAFIVSSRSTEEQRFRDLQSRAHPQFAKAFQGNGTVVFAARVEAILVVDVFGQSVFVRDPLSPSQATVVARPGYSNRKDARL